MSEDNPFQAPAFETDPAQQLHPDKIYGGIGRAAYFGYSFLVGILNNVIQYAAVESGSRALAVVAILVGLSAMLHVVVQRLKNLGYSGWWCIGIIVPILNILVGLRCLACPEGYADHKTLDGTGKVILGIFFALFGLVIGAVVLSLGR